MGNTASSPSARLRRDPSLISSPRALGFFTPTSADTLGPESINSGFLSSDSSQVSVRSATYDGPQAYRRNQSHSFEAVDVRRSRSANAAVSTREEEGAIKGAPPPYTPPAVVHHEHRQSSKEHTEPPNKPHLGGNSIHASVLHRRAISANAVLHGPESSRSATYHDASNTITVGQRRYGEHKLPEIPSSPLSTLPEEYGYGIGSGIDWKNSCTPDAPLSYEDIPSIPTPGETRGQYDFDNVPAVIESGDPHLSVAPAPIEDPLELLKKYNTIFIVDDSASMSGGKWEETREALASLAETAAKYDTDGIDAYFINADRRVFNMRSGLSVKRQFDSIQPHGISLIAHKLEELLQDYLDELESARKDVVWGGTRAVHRVKPVNYIVITDGMPTDDPESVIVQAARRLDKGNFPVSQVGIQFVQVGNDPRATKALKELDDELPREYGIRDMVDYTPYSGGLLDSEQLIKILLGGINRRVDRKGARSIL